MAQRYADQMWLEFRILLTVGNVYPFLHSTGWRIVSVTNYVVSYSWIVVGMALLAYTNFLIMDHVSLLSQATHMLIVGAVAMTASLTQTLYRKKLEDFETLYCDPESLSPYGNSVYFTILKERTVKRKNNSIMFWLSLYGSCGAVAFAQPLIDSMAGSASDIPIVNGVWTNLPFVLWVPFDLENNYTAWLLTLIFEGLYLVICAIQVTASIVQCFTICDRILDQLKLNVWAIQHLDQRVEEMLGKRFQRNGIANMEHEYDECFYECIVQNCKHHLITIREFKRFLDVASIGLAVPFFGGAALLGMALITISAVDDPRVGPKCLAAILATSEAINMYYLCQAGQEFQEISNELFEVLFHSEWPGRSVKCAKAVMIMRYGCSRTLKLVAARLLTLNMELFSDLVNSAYSLFNLMAASKS